MFKGAIAKATINTSFVLGLRLVVQAGTLLLVARMLGAEQFGAFAGIAALAVLLGALSAFGTNLVLFGEVSRHTDKRNAVLSYAIPTTFLCGGLLLVVYMAIAAWLLTGDSLSWQVLLIIGFVEIVLQPFFGLMSVEHHALGRIARSQLMLSIPLLLRLCAAVVIVLFDFSPAIEVYAGGYFFASLMALLLGAYWLPEKWPFWSRWHLPNIAEWRHTFGYAAINVSKVAPAELDKTLAIKLLPLDSVGVYAAGSRVVSAVNLPIIAMLLSALPRLFRENDSIAGQPRRLLVFMYFTAFMYGLMLAFILWFIAPLLIVLFGAEYHGVAEVVRLLCFAIPGMALRLVAGNALMSMRKPWFRFWFEIVGMFVLVIASIVFVKILGVGGLPIGVAVAEWCMAIIGFFLVSLSYSKKFLKSSS